MQFAIVVVGVLSGVRIYELEKFITPLIPGKNEQVIVLTWEHWVLEVYRTVIETLQGIAWVLLIFFVVTLIAYAYMVVRVRELRK